MRLSIFALVLLGTAVLSSSAMAEPLPPACSAYVECCLTLPGDVQDACNQAADAWQQAVDANPGMADQLNASCQQALDAMQQAGYCGGGGETEKKEGASTELPENCVKYIDCCHTLPVEAQAGCDQAAEAWGQVLESSPESAPMLDDACKQAIDAMQQAGYCN